MDSDAATCDFAGGIPFTYAGAMLSNKTGMLHMRARWLSPGLGQFLTQDPLDYVDSFNRYAYAGFDSINGRDPFGLASLPDAGDPEPDSNDVDAPSPDAPELDTAWDGAARWALSNVKETADIAFWTIVKVPLGPLQFAPTPLETYQTVKALIEEGPVVLIPIKEMLDAGKALGDAETEGEAVEAGLELVEAGLKLTIATLATRKLGGGKAKTTGRGKNRVSDKIQGRTSKEQQALVDMAKSDSKRIGKGKGPVSKADADAYIELANEVGVPVRAKAADLSGAHGYGPVPAGTQASHIHINGVHVPVPSGYAPPAGSKVIQ